MTEVQKNLEQVDAQKTGPQNPKDSAKEARKQGIKNGADDFEKSLEKNPNELKPEDLPSVMNYMKAYKEYEKTGKIPQ